jgi:hypothetical protein
MWSVEQFAGALFDSKFNKVVYHESHDEAGNPADAGVRCEQRPTHRRNP